MKTNYSSPENPHNVKVGDMYEMSWGYDQTNVNYFQVTRTSAKGVWVREIGSKSVEGSEGFMCQNVVPNPNSFLDHSQWCGGFSDKNPETFRRIQLSNHDNVPSTYFNFRGRYFARPVKAGESTYNSWYA